MTQLGTRLIIELRYLSETYVLCNSAHCAQRAHNVCFVSKPSLQQPLMILTLVCSYWQTCRCNLHCMQCFTTQEFYMPLVSQWDSTELVIVLRLRVCKCYNSRKVQYTPEGTRRLRFLETTRKGKSGNFDEGEASILACNRPRQYAW
jgi:hypothetical protein